MDLFRIFYSDYKEKFILSATDSLRAVNENAVFKNERDAIELVRKTDYDKAIEALKEIGAYFDCMHCEFSGRTCPEHLDERMEIANQALKELGVSDE